MATITPTVDAGALGTSAVATGKATLLASAARTAAVALSTDDVANPGFRGGHIVINVTASAATPSVVPVVEGKDPLSGVYYPLLTGAAITGTGTTVLTVYPGATPVTNVAVSQVLPGLFRVTFTHADTDSITYSAGVVLIP
jgi:hypothetical protein